MYMATSRGVVKSLQEIDGLELSALEEGPGSRGTR